MLPIYPGGHVAYQNFVVEQLRNHYANPAELPDALLDIAERFWEKDLTGVDTLMQKCYSRFGPEPRPPSCMLRSVLLSITLGFPSYTKWVEQLKTVPAYAILSGFKFGDTPVIMDMALHINDIVADGADEHIDPAAAHRVIAFFKLKGMREDALLGAGGHIVRFVRACFKQTRELVAVAFRVTAHGTVMGNPMLIDPSDLVFRGSLAVVGVHRHTGLLIAEGMGGSQLCRRRFHGVRRVTLSADDAEVGVVILAGLGGNRQPQRGGFHAHIIIHIIRQLVGRRRGIRIILPIPLIGQLVAPQALCRDGEGDPVIVQQAVFRLFLIIVVDRDLALDALGLAGDDDGAAADVAADLAHALGVKFMVGRIQLFTVAIAAEMPVLCFVG